VEEMSGAPPTGGEDAGVDILVPGGRGSDVRGRGRVPDRLFWEGAASEELRLRFAMEELLIEDFDEALVDEVFIVGFENEDEWLELEDLTRNPGFDREEVLNDPGFECVEVLSEGFLIEDECIELTGLTGFVAE
jgi:hypothetical protein